jgi:hypothetical protein
MKISKTVSSDKLSSEIRTDLTTAPEFAHIYKNKKSWVNNLCDSILRNKATATSAKSVNLVATQPPKVTWDVPKNLNWEEWARGIQNVPTHSGSASSLNPSDPAKTSGVEKGAAQVATNKEGHQGKEDGNPDNGSGSGLGTSPPKPSTQRSAARYASDDVYMSGGLGEHEGGGG